MSWFAPHDLVDDHFAARTSAGQDRRMWRHLRRCDRCRARYRSLTLLESLETDGTERARHRMGHALFAPTPAVPRRAVWGLALAAATAIALVVALPRERDRFTARGRYAPVVTAPLVSIFRVAPGAPPERVGSVVHAGDALAFSYLNPPEVNATHLMVFAVDEARHVYWFWPAWTSPEGDPAAIAIRPSTTPVELPEAVRHPLPSGPLVVYWLFARQPHHVREVEAAVAAGALNDLHGVLAWQLLEVLP